MFIDDNNTKNKQKRIVCFTSGTSKEKNTKLRLKQLTSIILFRTCEEY